MTAQSIQFSFGGDDPDDGEDDDEEGEGDDEPEGDKDDDLESAFLMLDTARAIYAKQPAATLKLADVHRLLGDVATEGEQFDSAVAEYSSALEILRKELPPHDRALSELHMLIALALDFVPDKVAEAVQHAEKAKAVLVLRLAFLDGSEEKDDERKTKDAREAAQIRELMGDVDMKVRLPSRPFC